MKISVQEKLNHDDTWFANPDGWIGGEDHSDWDGIPNETTAYHRDYQATLHKSTHKTTVEWKNYNDTLLERDTNVVGGTIPHYDSATPERASDDLYDYVFDGWTDGTDTYGVNDELPKVSTDDTITYTAVYRLIPKYATVNGYTGTYDKASHSVSVVFDDGISATAEYSVKNANSESWSDWSTEAPAETNVCDKQVRVRVTYNDITTEVPDAAALKITKATASVTVIGQSDVKPYDKAEHSVSGYEFTSDNTIYTQDDFSYTGSQTAARTDAGTTYMGLNEGTFANTNPNFENVTFSVTDGYQTITEFEDQIVVTIIGKNNTCSYDGDTHEVSGYDVTISGELYSEDDFSFTGTAAASLKNAGTENMGLTESMFRNNNLNFTHVSFVVIDGYQTIDPIDVTVTITGNNNTADYDGGEHRVDGYEVEFSSALYTENDFSFSGNASAVRTDAGTTYMGLAAEQFTNTNNNFSEVTFEVTDGYQKIDPIDVTVKITGHNNTADYDGSEHSVSGYDVEIENELYKETDFTFNGSAEAARTDAGTTYMGLAAEQFTNTNNNFAKVTFEVTDGYQTIDPIDVTVKITGHNNTTDYDGTEHSVAGYDVEINSLLYTTDDFMFNGTAEAKRTEAGTSRMWLDADQFININENFANVTFDVTDGYQTINKIDVTVLIKGHTDSVVYDGAEHTISGYDVEFTNPLYTENDFTFSGSASAKQQNVGKKEMGLNADQFHNTNDNFNAVTFDITDGYQQITQLAVTVTIIGNSLECDYDGNEHFIKDYTFEATSELISSTDISVNMDPIEVRETDAGTYYLGLSDDMVRSENPNFDVTFEVTDGCLKINPIDVTVTIEGAVITVDYDGAEHMVSGYSAEATNELYDPDEDLTYSGTAAVSRTNAGKTDLILNEDWFENSNPNFKTVTLDITDGYIEIKPIDVTVQIVGKNLTTDYDGSNHSVEGFEATCENNLYNPDRDLTFNGDARADLTDAGTSYMGLDNSQFTNTNENFKTVTLEITDGYVTVNPIEVTVTITGHKDDDAVYNGGEYSVSGYDAEFSNPLYTIDDFSFNGAAEASRTDAGTSYMGLTVEKFENISGNFTNVQFIVIDGYQTVNPAEITVIITGNNDEVNYNGNSRSVSGYEFNLSEDDIELYGDLYTEDDFTGPETCSAARTDAGTEYMGLKNSDFANANNNFAVTFDVTDGYITVNPAVIRISPDNITKTYDNNPDTDPELNANVSDKPENGVEPVYTLTRESGQDCSEYLITVNVNQDANPNYSIVTVPGTFTIQPADITITADNLEKEYDNNPENDPLLTATVTYKPENGIEPVYSLVREEGQDADTYEVTVQFEEGTNPNYNITVVPGSFTIKKKLITIKPVNKSKTYDNDASTDPVLQAEVIGLVEGDVVEYELVREEGQFAGIYEISVNVSEEDFPNYSITAETGTFEISKRIISIIADSKTKKYDNDASTDPLLTATVTDVPDNGDKPVYSLSRVDGQDVGEYNITVTADPEKNPNYEIETSGNIFKITLSETVTVTITGNSETATYDGQEHTASGYTVTSISNELYSADYITCPAGAHTDPRINVGTTQMGLSAQDFQNTNTNFDVRFVVNDGSITIEPRSITIKADNKAKTYDKKESTDPLLTATVTNAVQGDEIKYSLSRAEGQNVNEYLISVSVEEADNPNYTITTEPGTFIIYPATLTFSIDDKEKVYDNNPETDPVLTGTVIGLADGDEYEPVFVREEGQTVGQYKIQVAYVEFENYLMDTDAFGIFEIKPASVKIIAEDQTKDYDNNEATDPELTVKYEGLIDEEAIPYGSIYREVGQNAGEYVITVEPLAAEEYPNYSVTAVNGTFMIKPADITIAAINRTKEYDNDASSDPELTVDINGVPNGGADPVYSISRAAGQDVGEYKITVTAQENANPNYNVTFEDGTFIITPKAVKVKINNVSKDYDNNPDNDPELTAEVTGVIEGDRISYELSREPGQNAGTYIITGSADSDAKKNYSVTFENGTFTINKIDATVIIKGHFSTNSYDNTEHTVTGYDVEIGNTLYKETDIKFTGTAEAKQKDVGTAFMGLEPEMFENTNQNFGTVTFVISQDGYQEITPIDVTVTIKGHTGTDSYDNTEHTVTGYDVEISNTLYKETDIKFTGTAEAKQKDVGTAYMGLEPEMFENTNPNFGTVTFVIGIDGYQTITPIDVMVTIIGNNSTDPYDNTEHMVSGYEVQFGNDLYTEDDFKFTGTAEAKQKDVGTAYMGLEPEMFENTSANFGTVTFVIEEDGYQTITKAVITVSIIGNDDVKTFDNNEYTVSGYRAQTECSFYDTENDIAFDGTAEAKRKDAGITFMGLKPEMFTNTNENFDVTFDVTDGQMWITEVDEVVVKITGHKYEGSYDATEKIVSGFDIEASNDLFTMDDIKFTGNAEVSGKNAGRTSMGLDADQFENTNTNFKKVTFIIEEDGFVDIRPVEITLKANDITITEGEAEPELTVSAELFGDDTISYDITREEGTEPGEYKITVSAEENQGNYRITSIVNGTFTIKLKVYYYLKAPSDLTWVHDTLSIKEFEFARNVDDHTTIEHSSGFKVDGNDIPADAYTIRSGSVIISLKPEYLQTLALGKHTIEAFFDDGESVTAEFTIVPQKDVNPSTGDDFEAYKMMLLMIGSAACFIVLLLKRRKEDQAEA